MVAPTSPRSPPPRAGSGGAALLLNAAEYLADRPSSRRASPQRFGWVAASRGTTPPPSAQSTGALAEAFPRERGQAAAAAPSAVTALRRSAEADAAFSRLEAKFTGSEVHQRRLERTLAELGGTCRGLSDELQPQIRRIDVLDGRMRDWRNQLEEEMRGRLADLERHVLKVDSAFRCSSTLAEDVNARLSARLARLESLVDERFKNLTALSDMDAFEKRLFELEEGHAHQEHLDGRGFVADAEAASKVEAPAFLADLARQVQSLTQDSHELHARLETHEERFRTLHTRSEAADESHRRLASRVVDSSDVSARLQAVHGQVTGHAESHAEHSRRFDDFALQLERLSEQVSSGERAHRDLHALMGELRDHADSAHEAAGQARETAAAAAAVAAAPVTPRRDIPEVTEASASASTAAIEAVRALETRVDQLTEDLSALAQRRSEAAVVAESSCAAAGDERHFSGAASAEQVAALARALALVAPKLQHLERGLCELSTQVHRVCERASATQEILFGQESIEEC